jgi:mono/diheme cytochrome c family protein
MRLDPQLFNVLKRLVIVLAALGAAASAGLLITYEVIGVEWISAMEIQPSFRPMEAPLPAPQGSVPIQGAAYVPGAGAPANPVPSDEVSLQRGEQLYTLNCGLCHGAGGKGDGSIARFLTRKPADLTSADIALREDGDIFLVISNGLPGKMPALRENLPVLDRWDEVNYVRSLGR